MYWEWKPGDNMREFLKKQHSLRFLLGSVIVVTVVAVESVGAVYEYFSERQRIIETMQASSAQSLARLEKNIAPFIESYAPNEYAQLVATEFTLKNYFAIVVRDFNMGKVVGRVEYISGMILDSGGVPQNFDVNEQRHREAIKQIYFSESKPMHSASGELLGEVTVYISDEALNRELSRILGNAIASALINIFLLIVLLLLFSQRLLINPLGKIERSLARQDADGIPLNPPPDTAIAEISRLTGTIATMLEVIRRSRDALQLERTRLKNVIDGAHAGTWEWNIPTGALVINERWAAMLGYTVEELAPVTYQTWANNVHPADIQQAMALIEQHFSGKSTEFRVEIRMRHKLGHWVWVLGMGRVASRAEDGKPLLMSGTHIDISESKRQAAELASQRHRLNEIITGTNVGTWEWNVQTGAVIFNERWAEIVGYSLAELEPVSIESWTKLAHPDDLECSNELLQQHFSGLSPFYEFEARMRHKQGHWVWVLDRGKVSSWTEDGKPLFMFGTHQDITARKTAEEQLSKSLHYNRSLIEASLDPLVTISKDGKIMDVNRATEDITGVSRQQLTGSEFSDYFADPEKAREGYRQVFLAGYISDYPLAIRHIDGHLTEVLYSASTFLDEQGEVAGVFAAARDITKLKETVEHIEHMALFDALTELPNRVMLNDRFHQALASAKRDRSHLALLFIDLDRFKPVNDTYGHHIGDLLLIQVANRMRSCIRESDTVARIGGDEFVVLLPDVESESDALAVADKIRIALRLPIQIESLSLEISSSIGIALYPLHGQDWEALSKNADAAMYRAKAAGRDTAVLASCPTKHWI